MWLKKYFTNENETKTTLLLKIENIPAKCMANLSFYLALIGCNCDDNRLVDIVNDDFSVSDKTRPEKIIEFSQQESNL